MNLQKDFKCPRRPHLKYLSVLVQKSNKDDLGCFLKTSCHPSSGSEGYTTPLEESAELRLPKSLKEEDGVKDFLRGEAKTDKREPVGQ